MTTPTVTISVGGVPITATTTSLPTAGDETGSPLYMMYVQAVKDDTRYQWVVIPPARAEFGVTPDKMPDDKSTLYLLSRVQRHAGNRSKWFHHRIYSNSTPLPETVKAHAEKGYTVSAVVAVPLESDDYQTLWNTGETPHKALRAVDRVLTSMGLTVK